MDLNIINIMYMFFRLAPFIIVSYFTLQSLFNQDLKGCYLFNWVNSCIICDCILGGILKKFSPPKGLMPTDYSRIRCTQLTLGKYTTCFCITVKSNSIWIYIGIFSIFYCK